MLVGGHCIKQWSKTQASIALSSGEAELYAIVKGTAEGLGLRTVAAEMGRAMKVQICTDSSAAKGAALRTGAGRLQHVQTNMLWMQEKIGRGEVTVRKVPREQNVSDLFTHHWVSKEGRMHLPGMNFATAGPEK